MFFNQRLLNADERFSLDNFYLFMAASLIEQDQLERQISISGIKGVSDTNASGEKIINLNDPYAVFTYCNYEKNIESFHMFQCLHELLKLHIGIVHLQLTKLKLPGE